MKTIFRPGRPGAALVEEVGGFGTLLLTHKDWDRPALHQASMWLLAQEVMPKLNGHLVRI